MNVGYHHRKGSPVEMENNIFTFSCSKPEVIQSSEIKKIQTDITLEVAQGYVLTIFTASNLFEQAAEVFPGPYVLDSNTPKKILEIPVRNHARNPLHLMEGTVIARGYLTQVAEVVIREIEPMGEGRQKMKRTVPQKKNSNIKFEVK